MFDHHKVELNWGGQPLTLETGKIARQADGAVVARLGDTIVLCTAVGARSVKPGQDFFPLTVNYQEKTYAAGMIPGGFFKREGRPSEFETLTSRLIDRPIRPLFASVGMRMFVPSVTSRRGAHASGVTRKPPDLPAIHRDGRRDRSNTFDCRAGLVAPWSAAVTMPAMVMSPDGFVVGGPEGRRPPSLLPLQIAMAFCPDPGHMGAR